MRTILVSSTAALALSAIPAMSQDFTPEYIGGYPTAETAQAAFDEYDYTSAVQFFIWGYAYLNGLGVENGFDRMGAGKDVIVMTDKRMLPQHEFITPNDEVTYVWGRVVDISKGPVVYEIPPRTRGHIFDLGMRAYEDVGDVGPDNGEGGKYLIYPSDYEGELPDGYFNVPIEHSNLVTVMTRTFPATEGSLEAAVEHGKTMRRYYLAEADNPPEQKFFLMGEQPYNQEWPRDAEAFEWLAEVFEIDKVPAAGLSHMGNMRRLGIVAGEPFAPDDRAKAILKRAASVAEPVALSMSFRPRVGGPIYENRQYRNYVYNKSPKFLQENYEEVEERTHGWHQLVGNFAAYTPAEPGEGQFSMISYTDADGEYLIGSNTYRLNVPADVPVAQFWQIPVYEVRNRALIQNEQGRTSLAGNRELAANDDGSFDLWFAPELPEGVPESNWVQTIPEEGWFTLPRLYAPLEPILNKEWRWNDIERVE